MTSHSFLPLPRSCPRCPRKTQMGRLCAGESGTACGRFAAGVDTWLWLIGGGVSPRWSARWKSTADELGGGGDGCVSGLFRKAELTSMCTRRNAEVSNDGKLTSFGTDVIGAFSCTARSGPRRRPSPCSLERCPWQGHSMNSIHVLRGSCPAYEVIRESEVQRASESFKTWPSWLLLAWIACQAFQV